MDELLLLIRLILAVIFGLPESENLLTLTVPRNAIKDFGVPENLAKPFSVLLPAAEMFIALSASGDNCLVWRAFRFFSFACVCRRDALSNGAGKRAGLSCFGQIHSEPVGKKV
jgi:hypothetical protein